MSLEHASAALDASDGLYFLVGDDGTLVEWNGTVRDVTGRTDEELATHTPAELFETSTETGVNEAMAAARVDGESTIEASLVVAGGENVPYEVELLAVDAGVAGIGREVTRRLEQRESLQRRERVLRGMYDIVSDTERSFEEQVAALLLLGRQELDLDYGTLSQIDDEEYVFEVVSSEDDAVQAGETVPLSATNCELVATDERSLVLGNIAEDAPEETDRAGYAEWGISCYLGAPVEVDDEVYGTFCFYDTDTRTDGFSAWHVTLVDLMSRWVSYELERKRTNERLRRQNRKLDRFAAIVSHDLRNPLNVLAGSLELAEETGEREHFERAAHVVERMETLIDDLLVLARAGETVEAPERVDLAALARDSWEGVETGAASLVVETQRPLLADASRLRQLLENLVRNSVEHGSTDGGDDALTVTVGDLETGFYVADDGVGIPEPDRETVFESGFSTLEAGTGFGLPIVDEIAEAHGWTVRATESEAGGARVEFTGVERPADAAPEAVE